MKPITSRRESFTKTKLCVHPSTKQFHAIWLPNVAGFSTLIRIVKVIAVVNF